MRLAQGLEEVVQIPLRFGFQQFWIYVFGVDLNSSFVAFLELRETWAQIHFVFLALYVLYYTQILIFL